MTQSICETVHTVAFFDEACIHLQAMCAQVCHGLKDLISQLQVLQATAGGEGIRSVFYDDAARLDGMVAFLSELKNRAHDAHETELNRQAEFLATIAHEMRNVMAPLLSASEGFCLAQLDEETRRRTYESIGGHVRCMARLVDDLLDMGKMRCGKIDLLMEPVDLAVPMAAACEAVQALMIERRHFFEVAYPPGGLPVRGDPMRLEQVITNLLQNAAKYTDPGGRVWLSGERVGEEAVVEVRDSGRGMSRDIMARIFEPFFQAKARQGTLGGVGLGLTLVKRLVGLHQGTVEVESAGPGQGSRFRARFPLLREEGSSG